MVGYKGFGFIRYLSRRKATLLELESSSGASFYAIRYGGSATCNDLEILVQVSRLEEDIALPFWKGYWIVLLCEKFSELRGAVRGYKIAGLGIFN